MKKTKDKLYYCLLMVLIILPTSLFGQSVKRQSIGSYGTNGIKGGAIVGQTIGQPFATVIFSDNQVNILPGFQQPVSYKKNRASPEYPKDRIVKFDVFPNPASVAFRIKSNEILENVKLQITDAQGRLILREQISNFQQFEVNTYNWEPGLYLIMMSSGSNRTIAKNKVIITK